MTSSLDMIDYLARVNPGMLAVFSTLAAVLLTSLFSTLTVLLTKVFEDRRARRELLIKAAVENWKERNEITRASGGAVLPLDDFILRMVKLDELCIARRVTTRNVARKLRELSAFSDQIAAFRRERNS